LAVGLDYVVGSKRRWTVSCCRAGSYTDLMEGDRRPALAVTFPRRPSERTSRSYVIDK